MNEPTTEAGRALLAEFGGKDFDPDTPQTARDSWLELQAQVAATILAIEAEARDNLATRLGTRLLDEKDVLLAEAIGKTTMGENYDGTGYNPTTLRILASELRAALLRAVETDHE